MKEILNDASEESKSLEMHLSSSKMHDASDECQFILMHPKKVTPKQMHPLSYAQMQMRQGFSLAWNTTQ